MIPKKVTLKDFLSYEDMVFDFSDITDATVTGENGAGKTSLFTDSITWALFGQGSKGGAKEIDNYVKLGADSCTVEFEFELNENVYKVIRHRNVTKGSSSLSLYAVIASGSEVPLANGKLSETQKYIENLLHMNYKTFVASSMVLQNKSNEFTENMTDAERKETLFNILDIDLWGDVGEKAKDDAATIKSQIAVDEQRISTDLDTVGKKQEYLDEKDQLQKDLAGVENGKARQKKIIEDNQQKIFEMQTVEKDISDLELKKADAERQIRLSNDKAVLANRQIQSAIEEISSVEAKIRKADEIISRKSEIETAYKKESVKTAELQVMEQSKIAYLEKQNEVNGVIQSGKEWNTNHTAKIEKLNYQIKNNKEKAEALNDVPCASNTSFNTTCPFLKMANKAKAELVGLNEELVRLSAEVNPFRKEYVVVKAELDKLEGFFSNGKIAELRAEITEIKKVSGMKNSLDIALANKESWESSVSALNAKKETAMDSLSTIQSSIESLKVQVEEFASSVSAKKKGLDSFSETKMLYTMANDELSRLENQEKSILTKISSLDTLLNQVDEAEKRIEDIKKSIVEKQKKLKTISILLEACGKKSGVPALIIENSVPELESNANRILDKMLNGRLQIRIDTQVEGKTTGNVQEVFRIIVLEDGYERPYQTYSGAEKFIVSLSLRIAMSKFLAHRAGASVQLFVLDEGVSCADEENRHEILSAIHNLSSEFAKIIFITHDDSLKDGLSQRIFVRKDSMSSRAIVESAA